MRKHNENQINIMWTKEWIRVLTNISWFDQHMEAILIPFGWNVARWITITWRSGLLCLLGISLKLTSWHSSWYDRWGFLHTHLTLKYLGSCLLINLVFYCNGGSWLCKIYAYNIYSGHIMHFEMQIKWEDIE